MNGCVERFVRAIRHERRDRLVAWGEYAAHHHAERPHEAVGNAPLLAAPPSPPVASGEVECRELQGGLLRHYVREAA
jgi:hypothetical protein